MFVFRSRFWFGRCESAPILLQGFRCYFIFSFNRNIYVAIYICL
nr:MAG TPA: hypothetical protein [Caudoviricetes sp.]